jgi:hypothetical protein
VYKTGIASIKSASDFLHLYTSHPFGVCWCWLLSKRLLNDSCCWLLNKRLFNDSGLSGLRRDVLPKLLRL